MNKVLLTGRITKDPEVKYTSNGIANVNFTVAVDRGYKDQSGQRQADFINCVAWRQQADFISRYVKKGNMLAVEGNIQTRNYQGQDGQTKYITEVVVDSVENLSPRDPNQATMQPQSQNYQQPYNNYNNPGYGNSQPQNQTYQQPQQPRFETNNQNAFNINVEDDDLPF